MDIKIDSITKKIMSDALKQAKKGRATILKAMDKEISKPNSNMNKHAPKMITMTVKKEKNASWESLKPMIISHLNDYFENNQNENLYTDDNKSYKYENKICQKQRQKVTKFSSRYSSRNIQRTIRTR